VEQVVEEDQAPARRHVAAVRGRAFDVGIPSAALAGIQAGVFRTRYRGLAFCKNPFDVVLYLQLIERLRPRTIIEVGSFAGGSALWFRDQLRSTGIACGVVSIDLEPPPVTIDGVSFHRGDSLQPDATFPHAIIEAAPHPWLVIEDSAHTYESVRAVLAYFDPRTRSGDYIVVEDGVVADLPAADYGSFADGPNRAVAEFLNQTGPRYLIDESLCDFYGPNVTYCPNAWLVRA